MVVGLALFSWNQTEGSVLDVQYPESLPLSDSLINKIYMTHAFSEDFKKEELIEINYENQVILSYCDKSRVPEVGYEIIILIFHEKEKINSYNLKKQLITFANTVFQSSNVDRNKIFLQNVKYFFKKSSAKKILLLGRAGTGKSSIKKIIFEGKNPKSLLYDPLAPTRGLISSVYSWLDLDLGLFDSSGQELPYLLSNEEEQKRAFGDADAIIYLFDYQSWVSISQEIIKEIQTIKDIIKKNSPECKLILFLHKIDLIRTDNYDDKINEIKNLVQNQLKIPIYFTSIYLNLIFNLYNAFFEILSSFSEETSILKSILDENIKDFSKIMCFITDQNNSIIVQTMSSDFNILLINHSHRLIAQLNQTFEDMTEDQIEHVILSSSNNLNIIMNNLNLSKFNIKNLIVLSEKVSANKLILLVGKMRAGLNRYLYFKKNN